MNPRPPAYAWDWFSRQRLLWREARAHLARRPGDVGARYQQVNAKPDVVPMLRNDYPDDPVVAEVVDDVVRDLVFLGRTDRPFEDLGIRNPPRGLRWWWRRLTGEDVEHAPAAPATATAQQLDLDDVLRGYGD